MKRTVIVGMLATQLAVGGAGAALAQDVELEQRSLSGPRLGLTVVTGNRSQDLLQRYSLDPLMSQFGWHFEQAIKPHTGGPMFVIEEVLLVGAVEQQTAIPSVSLIMGIRMPGGFEFGIGPNATPAGSALAIGIGKSIQYGAVALPLNLAIVRSPGSVRISFLFGYAIEQRRDLRQGMDGSAR